jgi:hypothetical protein
LFVCKYTYRKPTFRGATSDVTAYSMFPCLIPPPLRSSKPHCNVIRARLSHQFYMSYNNCSFGHYPSSSSFIENNVSETEFCLRPKVKAYSIGPNRQSLSLSPDSRVNTRQGI